MTLLVLYLCISTAHNLPAVNIVLAKRPWPCLYQSLTGLHIDDRFVLSQQFACLCVISTAFVSRLACASRTHSERRPIKKSPDGSRKTYAHDAQARHDELRGGWDSVLSLQGHGHKWHKSPQPPKSGLLARRADHTGCMQAPQVRSSPFTMPSALPRY
jgi:hypothetical protein